MEHAIDAGRCAPGGEMSAHPLLLSCLFACLLLPTVADAGERWTIGLSTKGAPIEAVAIAGRSASSPTVLLVGGLEGSDQSSDTVAREAATFEQTPQNRRAFRLIAVARANPDATPLQFPPTGVAYREHVESHVLWRWAGTHAPDLVLVAGPDPGLVEALSQNIVIDVGRIPARRVDGSTRVLQSLTTPSRPRAGTRKSSAGWRDRRERLPRSWRACTDTSSRSRTTSPPWRSSAGFDSANETRSRACWRRTSTARKTALRSRRSPRSRRICCSSSTRDEPATMARAREGAGAARGGERLHRERRAP